MATIKELREKGHVSAGELAKQAKISRQVIYSIEHGNYNPIWTTVRKLAKVLGVNLTDIEV